MTNRREEFAAARAEARAAVLEHDDAVAWFESVASSFDEPLAVEVWVLDQNLEMVLLVNHRWRGWVPPGGAVEPGELPREAAARELREETGLRLDLALRPAAVAVRSYHPDWSVTLGLSYAAFASPAEPTTNEIDQPAAWHRLNEPWDSMFSSDRARMLEYVRWLEGAGATSDLAHERRTAPRR